MEEKKSKKGIIIGITSLLLVTLILLGLTYAYYRTRIVGNDAEKSISVTSKKMEVTYQDGTATLSMEGNIEPGFTATKTFYVTNTGDQDVKYSVILDEMTNEFIRNQDWKVTLTKNGEEVISDDDNVYLAVGTHQVLLGSVEILAPTADAESKDTYVLTVTYVNEETIDQSEDMGSNLTFRVNISDEAYTWETAPSGSLLYALKANQPTGTEETVPGQEGSTENEARILTTEDDYGTSYVYRGSVTNNYVTYSGMCWRIVRVQGDGSIKLALADGAHSCGTANGYSSTDTDSAFVTDAEENARINIAYKLNQNYDATDFPFVDSNIPPILSTWAVDKGLATKDINGNLIFKDELAESEWCNDVTVAKDVSFGFDDEGALTKDQKLASEWYASYNCSSVERLVEEPNLKCNFEGISDTKSIRYKNVLGILSADEVAFAGGTLGKVSKHYLITNTQENWYWTMTANFFTTDLGLSGVWTISDGFISESDSVSHSAGSIRPSVVLRSDVTLKTGLDYTQDGTIDAPYVIG